MSQSYDPVAIMNNADTHSGITNAKLGVWLFLASEIMLFATLFTSYIVLRMGASSWPWGWDVLNVPLKRPACIETTALGAIVAAGLGARIWHNLNDVAQTRKSERTFTPKMKPAERKAALDRWRCAVAQARLSDKRH